MTDKIQTDCLFLAQELGRVPLPEMQEHLASCAGCSDFLTEGFGIYLEYPQREWLNIKLPPGIASPEQFLDTAHRLLAEKADETNALWEEIRSRWVTDELMMAMRRFLHRCHRGLFFCVGGVPRPVREKELQLLDESYKQLQHLLGHQAFAKLLGLEDLLRLAKLTKRQKGQATDPRRYATRLWRQVILPEVKLWPLNPN